MYLAMSRAAHREGYPEIGMYWGQGCFLRKLEHAAKFAELLGRGCYLLHQEEPGDESAAENGATRQV